MEKNYFLAGLDLKGRDCWVVGDNRESLDKTKKLKACGAKVTVVPSTKFDLADLRNQFLLVYCDTSNPSFTKKLFQACRQKKILLCAVDQPDYCDFVNLAVFERGPLKIGISTAGISPALARKIRQGFESSLKKEPLEKYLKYLGDFRKRVKEKVQDLDERRKALIEAVSDFEFEAHVKWPRDKRRSKRRKRKDS